MNLYRKHVNRTVLDGMIGLSKNPTREGFNRRSLKEETKLKIGFSRRAPYSPFISPNRRKKKKKRVKIFEETEVFNTMRKEDENLAIGFFDYLNIPSFVNTIADICNAECLQFHPNTFHYTVDLFFRYLALQWQMENFFLTQTEIYKFCLASLLIASKFEEILPMNVDSVMDILASQKLLKGNVEEIRKDIVDAELQILLDLDFRVNRATTLWFLDNVKKEMKGENENSGNNQGRPSVQQMAKFGAEIAMLEPRVFMNFSRYEIANAALFVAREMMNMRLDASYVNDCDRAIVNSIKKSLKIKDLDDLKGVRKQNNSCFQYVLYIMARNN